MAQPRVAVFFVGRITGWHHVRKNLKRFQERYNATFFLSLNTELFTESDILFCKYFGLGTDQVRAELTLMPEKFAIFKNMYSQYYHNDKCFQMIEEYCKKYETSYDIVVKSRADLNSTEPLTLEWPIHENRIYCPVHKAYQVKDEINYGDFKTMKLYSLLIDTLDHLYDTGGLLYGAGKHPMLPELVLFQYICQLNQLHKTNIIYINYDFSLHDGRFEKDALEKHTSKIAVFFPGRVRAWRYNIERLLELKIEYNATFFCSVNMADLDTDAKEFCDYFSIGNDQVSNEHTIIPSEFEVETAFYSQHYHTKKCFQLLEAYIDKNNQPFDTVFKYRVDVLSEQEFNLHTISKNTVYLSKSSYGGGFNDQFYYGDFTVMKRITYLFDCWIGWIHTKYFSAKNLLTNPINGRYPGVCGKRVVPEEYFFLSILYAVNNYGVNLQFFYFRWILHPVRKGLPWNQEIENGFREVFKYKINNHHSEIIQQKYNDLLHIVLKSDVPNSLVYDIDGIMWPS